MTTPQDGKVIAVTTDAQGNWFKPDFKDKTWTHAWGSDGLCWSRQEWENEVKKQKNWHRTGGGTTPESGGDLDNTWEGCPTVEIQQHARKDSTGKSFLPLNSTGNFRVFHERAPELSADATTAQRKAWWSTFYGTYYLNPDDKLLSYHPKADLRIHRLQRGPDWSGLEWTHLLH